MNPMRQQERLIRNLAVITVLAVCGGNITGYAAEESAAASDAQGANSESAATFGGSSSTAAQILSDEAAKKKALFRFKDLTHAMQSYYDFKERTNREYGLAFGADYNLLVQGADQSLGKDSASGGVLRFFGTWTLVGREAEDPGSLTYKIENRHRYGSIAPQALAPELGYAGLTGLPFSDAGSLLTNLFWHQSFDRNRWSFVAGIVDTTDYVDVYGLFNPWTDFSNLAFSTDPTIPVPNQGLGAAAGGSFAEHYYVLAGLADANGDPSHTSDSVDSFFHDNEYFKHVEVGWYGSWESRFSDNIHLTLWQVDARTKAQVPDGSGAAFSFSQKIDEQWLPFLRLGYADGGGAVFARSVSTGLGYYRSAKGDVFGLGFNWGRPNPDVFGVAKNDQYTLEAYYRVPLFAHLAVTPDIQLLINPVNNPDHDTIWVLGLRARLSF